MSVLEDETTVEVAPQTYQTPYILSESQTFIYDINAVPEITLDVSVAEWNKLLSYYDQNPQNEEYVKGNFKFIKNNSQESLDNIGLRLR